MLTCTLPVGATWVLMLLSLGAGIVAGLAVFAWFLRTASRRHPDDHWRRSQRGTIGVAVAVFLVLPLTTAVASEVARPILCDAYGSFEPSPGVAR